MSDVTPAPKRFAFLRAFALFVIGAASFAALVSPLALQREAIPLEVGEVAPRDLQAPYSVEYESELRTEEARQAAALTVSPVYSTADPSIARQQIENLRDALLFINMVRMDAYASPEQKSADLRALTSIQLEDGTIETILTLGDNQWDAIQQEALSKGESFLSNQRSQFLGVLCDVFIQNEFSDIVEKGRRKEDSIVF